jgi:3-oxoacyl-[acyl-carrier-protein] synthase III
MKVKITGTGSCLPKLRVTNDDLGQIMETSDEWIRSRTGIIARHIAVEETTTGMSTEAAGKALKNAEISAEDVDIIIAATVSADKHLPGLACEVQKNIGAENAVAFDINAACSGFHLFQGLRPHRSAPVPPQSAPLASPVLPENVLQKKVH